MALRPLRCSPLTGRRKPLRGQSVPTSPRGMQRHPQARPGRAWTAFGAGAGREGAAGQRVMLSEAPTPGAWARGLMAGFVIRFLQPGPLRRGCVSRGPGARPPPAHPAGSTALWAPVTFSSGTHSPGESSGRFLPVASSVRLSVCPGAPPGRPVPSSDGFAGPGHQRLWGGGSQRIPRPAQNARTSTPHSAERGQNRPPAPQHQPAAEALWPHLPAPSLPGTGHQAARGAGTVRPR